MADRKPNKFKESLCECVYQRAVTKCQREDRPLIPTHMSLCVACVCACVVCVYSRVYQITLTLHIIKPQSRRLWRAKSEIKRNKQSSSYSAFLRTKEEAQGTITGCRQHWMDALLPRLVLHSAATPSPPAAAAAATPVASVCVTPTSTRLFPLDKLDKQLSALSSKEGCCSFLCIFWRGIHCWDY